jgi:NAD(P)-dependent dehydrogenase (short-subunit alcohol dehydrogenase family)
MNEKNALVTGASSGLGREIARLLYKNGFRVFVICKICRLDCNLMEVKICGM